MATLYQNWFVQHVIGADKPDFKLLKDAGYRGVTFMPQEVRAAQFIAEAKYHGLIAGIWTVDPLSTDSGMSGDPQGYADDVIEATKELDAGRIVVGGRGISCTPQIVQLNIEYTGKGYPTWRPSTSVKAWHRMVLYGWEWQTWADGTTGTTKPSPGPFGESGSIMHDGGVTWHSLTPASFDGWDWNELMVARLRRSVPDGGLPTRPMVVQPMGRQADFNYGAYLKVRTTSTGTKTPPIRISPQCYDGSMVPISPATCVDEIVSNGYVASHYPDVGTVPRSYIHPTLAAHESAWNTGHMASGPRGYTIFRADYMDAADLKPKVSNPYAPYMVA